MKKALIVLALLVALLVLPIAVSAAPLLQSSDPVGDIDLEIAAYAASLGLSFLTPFVIELLKRAGAVKDGMGGTWATVLNAAMFAVLVVLGAFGVDLKGDASQSMIEMLATAASLILMILGSSATFKTMRANEVPLFRPRN